MSDTIFQHNNLLNISIVNSNTTEFGQVVESRHHVSSSQTEFKPLSRDAVTFSAGADQIRLERRRTKQNSTSGGAKDESGHGTGLGELLKI